MGLLKSNYSSGQMECGKLWFPPDCAALHDMKILIVSFVDDETHQGINLVASVTAVEARFSYVIYSSQCVKDISFAMFGMNKYPCCIRRSKRVLHPYSTFTFHNFCSVRICRCLSSIVSRVLFDAILFARAFGPRVLLNRCTQFISYFKAHL